MKTKLPFLLALASASTLLILPSNSDEAKPKAPARAAEAPLPTAVLAKAHAAVNARVLDHLNPKQSLADRFSRRVVPRSMHYRAQFAQTGGDRTRADFKIIHNEGLRELAKGTVVAIGFYDTESGGVFLYDVKRGKHVRAAVHPLVAPKAGTI